MENEQSKNFLELIYELTMTHIESAGHGFALQFEHNSAPVSLLTECGECDEEKTFSFTIAVSDNDDKKKIRDIYTLNTVMTNDGFKENKETIDQINNWIKQENIEDLIILECNKSLLDSMTTKM